LSSKPCGCPCLAWTPHGKKAPTSGWQEEGADDKEVLVDPSNLDKKLQISTDFDPK
jgi:hypothetical protein